MEYIITAFLALIVGVALWFLKKERLSLEYEIIKSAPFPNEEGTGQYFIIRFHNSGNEKVEGINLAISFSVGSIVSLSFSNTDLINDVNSSNSTIRGTIPLLNPKEDFSLTVTLKGKDEIPLPEVNARAPGITATTRTDSAFIPSKYLVFVNALIIVLIGMLVFLVFKTTGVEKSILQIADFNLTERDSKLKGIIKDREKREQEIKLGKPNREQYIFSVFNRSGLTHQFQSLAGREDDIAFWRTGLFLFHSLLVDEENADKYISAAEMLLDVDMDIAISSQGFILYLLSKMEQKRGNKNKSVVWLEKCKEKAPLMYEHLMIQDPAYDIDDLQKYLLLQKSVN